MLLIIDYEAPSQQSYFLTPYVGVIRSISQGI